MAEPFAGGASVSLGAVAGGLCERAHLMELDEEVAAVWETIINRGEGTALGEKIISFVPTRESVMELISDDPPSLVDRALAALVKNRTHWGGICAPGSSLMGDVAARWYPETLARRVEAVGELRGRLSFTLGDGVRWMSGGCSGAAAIFADPPYTMGGRMEGRRLYLRHRVDHEAILAAAAASRGSVLATYHDTEEVRKGARRHSLEVMRTPPVSSRKPGELLVGRDLSWARSVE